MERGGNTWSLFPQQILTSYVESEPTNLRDAKFISQYMNNVYSAVENALSLFSATQTALTTNFWPNPPNSVLLEKELLNALSAVIGAAFTLGAEESLLYPVIGGLISGAIAGVSTALSASDVTLDHEAALELYV